MQHLNHWSKKIGLVSALLLGIAVGGAWISRAGAALAVPSLRFEKPVTIIVTFPPGGGTDLLARKLGASLQQRIGQTVIVDNRPGASGNIGARMVAQAAPDGSTLLMVNSSFAVNPGVYEHLDFDPRRDFQTVFNAGTIASALVVPADSPLQSLADLKVAAKAPVAFASCGNGTPQHLAGEMLAQAARIGLQHVPYKGCGPAVTAIAAGQVPLGVVTLSSAAPLMAAGRMRAIAVTSSERVAQYPGVPTVAEQGVKGFAVEQWHGLLAPAKTPSATIAQLHAALTQVLAEPAVQQSLRDQGYTLVQQSPQAFARVIEADMDRYAAVTARLGLRVD